MSNEQTSAVAEIKVAVIGFGLAGRVFHAPFVSAVPGLQLSSIVQRKGDEAAKAYPHVTILHSFEAALDSDAGIAPAEPGDVDVPNLSGTPATSQFCRARTRREHTDSRGAPLARRK